MYRDGATVAFFSSEDRDTDIEIEGGHGTEGDETGRQLMDGKEIRLGTQMLATHSYKQNPDSAVGNELDLNERETLVYLMTHDDKHWWLAEDGKKQVGYVPSAYLMIIVDDTLQEEDSDTTRKERQGKRTGGTMMGGEMGQDWRKKKNILSGSDLLIQEELYDLCGRLYS